MNFLARLATGVVAVGLALSWFMGPVFADSSTTDTTDTTVDVVFPTTTTTSIALPTTTTTTSTTEPPPTTTTTSTTPPPTTTTPTTRPPTPTTRPGPTPSSPPPRGAPSGPPVTAAGAPRPLPSTTVQTLFPALTEVFGVDLAAPAAAPAGPAASTPTTEDRIHNTGISGVDLVRSAGNERDPSQGGDLNALGNPDKNNHGLATLVVVAVVLGTLAAFGVALWLDWREGDGSAL